MVRRRVIVSGRVQGVFFRDSTRRQAESLGVAGWARNNPDGTAEVVFEGEPDAVARMIEFCREGPGHADVEEVEVFYEEPQGASGFETR